MIEKIIGWRAELVFGLPGDGTLALFRDKVHELL